MKKKYPNMQVDMELYDKIIEELTPFYSVQLTLISDFIRTSFKGKKKIELLGVGCGIGTDLLNLLKAIDNLRVKNIDSSEGSLAYFANTTIAPLSSDIRGRIDLDREKDVVDFTKYDTDKTYNVIFIPYVLHHYIPSVINSFFKRAFQLLKPGGKIIIVDLIKYNDDTINEQAIKIDLTHIQKTMDRLINEAVNDNEQEQLRELKQFWLAHYSTDNPRKMSNYETYKDILANQDFVNICQAYRYFHHNILFAEKKKTDEDTANGVEQTGQYFFNFLEKNFRSDPNALKFYVNPADLKNDTTRLELRTLYTKFRNFLEDRFGVVGMYFSVLDKVKGKPLLLFSHKTNNKLKGILDTGITQSSDFYDVRYHVFPHKELICLSAFATRSNKKPEYIDLIENQKADSKNPGFVHISHHEINEVVEQYDAYLSSYLKDIKIDVSDTFLAQIGAHFQKSSNYKLGQSDLEQIYTIADLLYEKFEKLLKRISENYFFSEHKMIRLWMQLYQKYLRKDNEEYFLTIVYSTIAYIKKIQSGETNAKDKLYPEILHKARFPVLTYSILLNLRPRNKGKFYSHIVFETLSSYSEETSYDKGINSIMHGVATIYEEKAILTNKKKIQLSLLLKKLSEPIADREYYKRIRDADIRNKEIDNKRYERLDASAYGLSHVIGSHLIPYGKQFSAKMVAKLMNLKVDYANRKLLANYFFSQSSLYQSFLSDVMFATYGISQPFGGISYEGHDGQDLQTSLESIFSLVEDGGLTKVNMIGRGILDGYAEGAISFNPGGLTGVEVALPSSTGKTYLALFIINYLRNLYKHSRCSSLYVLGNENKEIAREIGLDPNEKIKVYNARLIISEPTIPELKPFYLKLTIVDYSNKMTQFLWKGGGKASSVPNAKVKEIVDGLNTLLAEDEGIRTKGLEEMRNLAAALIGMPIELLKTENLRKDTIHIEGEIFPTKVMTYAPYNENRVSVSIYLKKKDVLTILVEDKQIYPPESLLLFQQHGIKIVDMSDKKNPQVESDFIVNFNSKVIKRYKTSKIRNFRYIYFEDDRLLDVFKNKLEQSKGEEYINHLKQIVKDVWVSSLPPISTLIYAYDKNRHTIEYRLGKEGKTVMIASHFYHFRQDDKEWEKEVYKDYYIECESSKSGGRFIMDEIGAGIEEDNVYDGEIEHSVRTIDTSAIANYYKVLETVHTKIEIYDEVLQSIQYATRSDDSDPDLGTVSFRETLRKKGIIIPSEDTMNMTEWFTGTDDNCHVDHFIEKIIERNPVDREHPSVLRYIIVHYSGFEKLIARKYEKYTKDKIIAELVKMNDATFRADYGIFSRNELYGKLVIQKFEAFSMRYGGTSTYVVFLSGKYPSNLKDNNVLFISRNTIDNLISRSNSKYSLVSALNYLRFKKA